METCNARMAYINKALSNHGFITFARWKLRNVNCVMKNITYSFLTTIRHLLHHLNSNLLQIWFL